MKKRLGKMFSRRHAILLGAILGGAIALSGQTSSSKHQIAVTFTYDFRLTPACSKKVRSNCVMQFNLYDLSAGYKHRTKLFSIPVGKEHERDPEHDHDHGRDHGAGVKEISGTSPLLLFESGKHLLGVSAQTPDNVESDPRLCKAWVEIP